MSEEREIKFRVWDSKRLEWLPDCDIDGYSLIFTLYGTIEKVCGPSGETWTEGTGKRYVLSQYTGLKDKNGKEIYEGDIIESWIDYGPAGERLETYPVTISPFGCNIQEWVFKEKREITVIGNIYENTELLEGNRREDE